MNEQEMIEALTEILMNHETGPLSNLGSSIELDDEGMIVVETHSIHPFTDSIDVPQLARELLLRLAGSRESLKPALLEAFASGHATSPEEFADIAARVAGAGVAPQELSVDRVHAVLDQCSIEYHHPEYGIGLFTTCAGEIATELAAPPQVDEAKLAELLLDHALDQEQTTRPAGLEGLGYLCECGLEILEPRTGPGIGWHHRKHVAYVVAEWLRGGGQ